MEQRYTAPLRSVMNQFHVPKIIDYMSLDAGGNEFEIMQHFPFDRKIIRILSVRRPSEELKNLLDMNDYDFLRILSSLGDTLWVHSSTGITRDHPSFVKWDPIITSEYED